MWNLKAAVCLALVTSSLSPQTPAPVAPAPSAAVQAPSVKVFIPGPGVTIPELLPSSQVPISTEKCKKKLNGPVEFSLVVDAEGKPRNIHYLRTFGAPVDQLALQLVATEQFKPGEHGGTSVAVARSVQVDLHACVADVKNEAGKKAGELILLTQSQQRWSNSSELPNELNLTSVMPVSGDKPLTIQPGGDIRFPKFINRAEAEFSEQARKARYQGTSLISLTIDEQGMPHDFRVVKAIGMGLDEKALEAVKQYRFSPATEYGVAVPVTITLAVNFQLNDGPP